MVNIPCQLASSKCKTRRAKETTKAEESLARGRAPLVSVEWSAHLMLETHLNIPVQPQPEPFKEQVALCSLREPISL